MCLATHVGQQQMNTCSHRLFPWQQLRSRPQTSAHLALTALTRSGLHRCKSSSPQRKYPRRDHKMYIFNNKTQHHTYLITAFRHRLKTSSLTYCAARGRLASKSAELCHKVHFGGIRGGNREVLTDLGVRQKHEIQQKKQSNNKPLFAA